MVKYDPVVIEKFARRLYARANGIILAWAVAGAFGGGAAGAMIGNALDADPLIPAVAAAALLGIVGGVTGAGRAFMLKLQAQTALCQVQIEANTRSSVHDSP